MFRMNNVFIPNFPNDPLLVKEMKNVMAFFPFSLDLLQQPVKFHITRVFSFFI